jgi:hypothetical protein
MTAWGLCARCRSADARSWHECLRIAFNLISTIVTTRNPTGDYGKALRALRG